MTNSSFISEINGYERIALGATEIFFIQIFAQRSYAAYELCHKYLKYVQPMSYPNTHKKIQRLVDLGLLEEEKGKFKRRAIPYKLTTRGLFERLLIGGIPPDRQVWWNNRDNIILQTLLCRFFETKTLSKFRQAGYMGISSLVSDYLKKCCEGILTKLELESKSQSEIEQIISNEFKDLILKLMIASAIEEEYTVPGKLRPNFDSYLTLRGDKKFFPILRDVKKEFDRGCKIFGL